MSAHAAVFGKLPAHGDFVSRGLDPSASAVWDAFASTGLEQARAGLGEGFEAAHDAAPPWRFVLGPGAFGPGWRAGALAASVDRAGRRFILAVFAEDLQEAVAARSGARLAAAMEDAIYLAFEAGLDADGLAAEADRALAAATPIEADAPGGEGFARADAGWWTEGNETHAAARLDPGADAGAVLQQALAPLQARTAA